MTALTSALLIRLMLAAAGAPSAFGTPPDPTASDPDNTRSSSRTIASA
jgi:hypothetical protein